VTADLFYLGITQRNAPLAVREAISPSVEKQRAMLNRLAAIAPGRMVVSTCERFELYAHTETRDDRAWRENLARWFQLPTEFVSQHARTLEGSAVARHLLSVSAGLDSRVLGEPQILGQVRDAYLLATECAALDPVLSALGRAAIRAGKRVRHETPISRGDRSIPTLAVDRILSARRPYRPQAQARGPSGTRALHPHQCESDVGWAPPAILRGVPHPRYCEGGGRKSRAGSRIDHPRESPLVDKPPVAPVPNVLVLGSGRLASDVAAAWTNRRAGSLTVIARNAERARTLAEPLGARCGGMDSLANAIAQADAIVACTAAPTFLVDPASIGAMRTRPLCIVDLCVPRNVDPTAAQIPGVTLCHLDELLSGETNPARIALDAEQIVDEECARFEQWRQERHCSQAVTELIRAAQSANSYRPPISNRELHQRIVRLKSHGVTAAATA